MTTELEVDVLPANAAVALTVAENEQLAEYERVIEQGLVAFHEVGTALLAIKEKRLYRGKYKTFEAYLRERWNVSRSRGYQLLGAQTVMKELEVAVSGTEVPLPESERQVREMSTVEPQKQGEVWKEAVATANGRQPTREQVKQAVEKVAPKAARPKAAPVDPDTIDKREVGPGDANEDEPSDKLSDQEFLEQRCAPRVREALPDDLRAVYDEDALFYRKIAESRHSLGNKVRGNLKGRKPGKRLGLFASKTVEYLEIPHPRYWLLCRCKGTLKGCKDACGGRGYVFP